MDEKNEMFEEVNKIEFTGERFVPQEISGEIEVEHFHRYMAVADLVKGKIVLDAASGAGYGSYFMSRTAKQVYGIDVSPEAVTYSQKKYEKDNLIFKENSIEKLDFPDAFFDVVISFETIEHVDVEIQNGFLTEVKRVLKDDGVFVISTPNKELYSDKPNYKNEFHVKEFYKDEFVDFLRKCFCEVQIYHQYFTGTSVVVNDFSDRMSALNFNKKKDGKYFIALASNREITRSERIDSVYEYEYKKESFATLFYFDGNDFDYQSFERTTYPDPEDGSVIDIKFDIIRESDKLRFDPLEGSPCKISVLDIKSSIKFEEFHSFNASHSETVEGLSYDVFWNDDPIYEITGLFKPGDSLEFKLKVRLLDSGETYFTLNRIINSQNGQIGNLNNQVEILKNESALLNNETKRLNDLIIGLNSETDRLNNKIAGLNDILIIKDNELTEKQNQLTGKQNELIEKQNELTGKQNELTGKQNELDLFVSYINDMQSSLSWRITKPLRNIKKIVKSEDKR